MLKNTLGNIQRILGFIYISINTVEVKDGSMKFIGKYFNRLFLRFLHLDFFIV